MKMFERLVDRFLAWPLPKSVCADAIACTQGAPHRTGTNLLTATEAREMFRYVLDVEDADTLETELAAALAELDEANAEIDALNTELTLLRTDLREASR